MATVTPRAGSWRAIPAHLDDLAKAIPRLLNAGWKQVWVVTDHGWLLLPDGLPKAELPARLTETKWGRCAVLKDAVADADWLEVDDLIGEQIAVVLRRDGQKVAKERMNLGAAWEGNAHAA